MPFSVVTATVKSTMDPDMMEKLAFLGEKFFKPVRVTKTYEDGSKNVVLQCLLCTPLKTEVSSSTTSHSNLKRHITRCHKPLLDEFSELCRDNDSRKR